jgi:antitoxin CptB
MQMLNQEEVKKIIYQSCHRGCKETDFILGDFAKAKVNQFDIGKLTLYQKLILEDDWNIYNWVVGRQETPDQYMVLINEIKEFSRQQFLS